MLLLALRSCFRGVFESQELRSNEQALKKQREELEKLRKSLESHNKEPKTGL